MLRIIVHFLLLTSFFTLPAYAQEDDKALSATQKPSIMAPDWKHQQPVPKANVHTGPAQPEHMALPPANLRHMGSVAPAQKKFGINMHLVNTGDKKDTDKTQGTQGPPAPVTGNFPDLRQMDTSTVEQVIDPLRIRLKDGRILQLAGIDIPDLDPYEPGDVSIAARNFLDKLLKGKTVRMYQTKDRKKGRMNRMGYHLTHLTLGGNKKDSAWVQGTLLAAGLARVRPSERNAEMAAQMIALEDKARTEKKGIWADPRYAVLNPETAIQNLNDWALVEGRIRTIATVNNVTYLNFGSDWRTDFTIALTANMRRKFLKAGTDPMKLSGAMIRARGWLREYNGPYMELLHPSWMNVVKEKPKDNVGQ